MEVTDKLIEEFITMFPNCPDPVHEPRQATAIWMMFLHHKGIL